MSHNLGLGGSAFVGILKRADFFKEGDDIVKRWGYDPSKEARRITEQDLDKVKSKAFSEYLPAKLWSNSTSSI